MVVTEVVCPLCGLPRARDAKQCVCNYTFEYDKLPAHHDRPAAVSPNAGAGGGDAAGGVATRPLIAILAALASVAAAVLLNTGVARDTRPRPEIGFALIAFGVFAACGGIFDWDFFMSNRRARRIVLLLGRGTARAFYALLGGALAGAGVWIALL